MKIILIGGLKHCGKSTLGKIIAEEINLPFFDLDDLILNAASTCWGSVREIWNVMGQSEFQRMEEDAARTFIDWFIPAESAHGAVLSLGGGTIDNTAAMGWLHNMGTLIYLHAEIKLLYNRIMKGGRPPFLSAENPWEDFQELYERRDKLYSSQAHLIYNVKNASIELNARRLLKSLEKYYVR